jgi:hypothetical protein
MLPDRIEVTSMKRPKKSAQSVIEFVLLVLFIVVGMSVVINNLKKQGGGMFDMWCRFSVKISQGCPQCEPVVPEEKPCPQ